MEAFKGYGEAVFVGGKWVSKPIEYKFICTKSTDPDQDELLQRRSNECWTTNPVFSPLVSPVASPGAEYEFTLRYVRRPIRILVTESAGSERTVYMAPPSIVVKCRRRFIEQFRVPLMRQMSGTLVLVHPGVYREVNIDFRGKSVTVRSENPENPAIVAATVIDCAEPNRFIEESRVEHF